MGTKRRPHGTGSVYQDARGRWVAALDAGWTAQGTRRRRRRIASSEREARQILAAMMRDQTAPGVAASTTVKTWAGRWLAVHQEEVRPHAYATDRTAVTKWIIPTVGHRRLDALTPADVRAVDLAQQQAGLAPSSVLRTRAVLHKLLRDARAEGHTIPDRVLAVKAPPKGESSREAIPTTDALAILHAAAGLPDGTRWVAAFLGLRPAEALGLTWERVHPDRLEIVWQLKALPYLDPADKTAGFRLPAAFVARHLCDAYHLVRPKTARGLRVVPITPGVAGALARWREIQGGSRYGLVWPRPDGRPQRDEWDREAWRELCRMAGVGPYDLYSARHTAVTELKRGLVDDSVAAAIVGHSKLLDTYRHIDMTETGPAIAGLASALGLD